MRVLLLASLISSSLALTACNSDNSDTPLAPVNPPVAAGTKLDLAVLQTTDLHANVMSYDYYKTTDDVTIGFERTATLIDAARKENPNNLLVDDGDTIQGTSLSDYQAQIEPVKCDTPLAIHKVMNFMKYDAGNIGNHEFNYGLPFLGQVTGNAMKAGPDAGKNCKGADFPLVVSNVNNASDNKPLFAPYVILDRTFKTADGKAIKLKVGVIGFTPPAIMNWDKRNLDGKVTVKPVVDAAKLYVPKMRAEGADIVVALSHGGISDAPYSPDMENAVYYLAQVPGIDAIVSGHSHSFFPDGKNYAGMKNVDNAKGLVNGVPTVMAGFWGNTLGVLKLNLQYDGKAWKVADSKGELKSVSTKDAAGKVTAVDVKPEISKLISAEHQGTIKYVTGAVGKTDYRISSFFSQVGATSSMQLINLAQTDYVASYIKANAPQYANLPILSSAAPFKVNFRGTGFTDIPAGDVAIKNIADLYLYPNTLQAVKIDGAAVKLWLEKAAEQFNTIDPAKTSDQNLINTSFPSYNFDQISGISYEIDVTKDKGSRIVNMTYNGKPLDLKAEFIVVTNNYRASGGGGFAGLDGSKTIIDSGEGNREIIINYVKAQKTLTFAKQGAVANWRFAKVTTAGKVLFESSADAAAQGVARQDKINNVFLDSTKADNSAAVFRIDLSK